MVLFGSVLAVAAAAWAHQLRRPVWVRLCVAAPVLIGWTSMAAPESLLPQLLALVALPAAFAGFLGGIFDRSGLPR
ncbi:MAG: hypothetical protein ABIO34_00655 [Arthrobacter oryzae]